MANSQALPVIHSEAPSWDWSITGTIANASTSVTSGLIGQNGAVISWYGTFAGITLNFEALYDVNGTWLPIMSTPVGGGSAVASVSSVAAANAYEVYAPGAVQVRVRSSAYTSGTMNVRITPVAMAQDPAPAIAGGTVSLSAATNAIGDVGIQYRTSSTGGAAVLSVLSPATPAATTVKAAAGRLIGFVLTNTSASVRSVKFWNLLVGSVTLGTTAALFEVDIPAGQSITVHLEGGVGFSTGITIAITGAKGLTDNTAVTLNDVSGVIFYA